MAVVNTPQTTILTMRVANGVSASGTALYAYRNYADIKVDATDEAIFAVAASLTTLFANTVSQLMRVNKAILANG